MSFSKKLLKFGRRVERACRKQKVKRALLFQQQNPRSPTFTHTLTLYSVSTLTKYSKPPSTTAATPRAIPSLLRPLPLLRRRQLLR